MQSCHSYLDSATPDFFLTLDHLYYFIWDAPAELSEETVKLLLVFPLLELAGFYDEPFFVTAEAPVQIEIQDNHEILKDRIDTLIIQQEIWILIVESKRSVALTAAIHKCLAYMLGNPQPSQPLYGMVRHWYRLIGG